MLRLNALRGKVNKTKEKGSFVKSEKGKTK